MLGDGRIVVCSSFIAQCLTTIVIDYLIVESLRAEEECRLRTLRIIIIREGLIMINRILQRSRP